MTFASLGPPEPPPLVSILPIFLRALRARRRLTFVLADNLGSKHGLVNYETAVVLLDARNTDGEMRATVAHELLHLIDPTRGEEEVEAETARMLVPLEAAMAARATGEFVRVADELLVDPALVRTRLRANDGASIEDVGGMAG